MVSSVDGIKAGTLLSPDVHMKDNRLAEKKTRDQPSQTAGNAKKSHIFQYGLGGFWTAALETKLALARLDTETWSTHEYPIHSFLYIH